MLLCAVDAVWCISASSVRAIDATDMSDSSTDPLDQFVLFDRRLTSKVCTYKKSSQIYFSIMLSVFIFAFLFVYLLTDCSNKKRHPIVSYRCEQIKEIFVQ